jgi:hypothetical protein
MLRGEDRPEPGVGPPLRDVPQLRDTIAFPREALLMGLGAGHSVRALGMILKGFWPLSLAS